MNELEEMKKCLDEAQVELFSLADRLDSMVSRIAKIKHLLFEYEFSLKKANLSPSRDSSLQPPASGGLS